MSSLPPPARGRISRCLVALVILAFVFLAAFLWKPVQRVLAMTALKHAVQRDDIAFDPHLGLRTPPDFIDEKVTAFLKWSFSKSPGPSATRAVDLYHAAYGNMLRDPIRIIEIRNPDGFRSDPGSALELFPNLRRLTLTDNGLRVTEADWTSLCTSLRGSGRLEQLRLGGSNLTDAAMAPLSNHPSLRVIAIDANNLTSASRATFSSMPRLNTLVITGCKQRNRVALTWAEKDTMVAALPGVDVVFRK